MRVDQARNRVDHTSLHVDERLAAGKAEATRVTLHLVPLRQLHQRLQILPRPLAEVALEQPTRRPYAEAELFGDRTRRLLGALERRGVDGCDLAGERRKTFCDRARLLAALVGEMQAVCPSRQCRARCRRLAVTDEKDERAGCGLSSCHDRVNLPLGCMESLRAVEREVVACRACPRLVAWREQVANDKVARFRAWDYWAKPVPGFGDPRARLVIIGLAPAAHGGNRTGRVFTGDRSG